MSDSCVLDRKNCGKDIWPSLKASSSSKKPAEFFCMYDKLSKNKDSNGESLNCAELQTNCITDQLYLSQQNKALDPKKIFVSWPQYKAK